MSYFTRALEELKPNSEWAVTGDQYSRLTWLDKNQTKPTEEEINTKIAVLKNACLLYTSPSPRDRQKSRMPSSA